MSGLSIFYFEKHLLTTLSQTFSLLGFCICLYICFYKMYIRLIPILSIYSFVCAIKI